MWKGPRNGDKLRSQWTVMSANGWSTEHLEKQGRNPPDWWRMNLFWCSGSMKKICQGAFTCKTKFKPIIFQFKNFCSSNKRLCFSCCLILFQCANLVRQVSLCETKCFNYNVRHSVYFSLFIYIFQEKVLSCSKKLCEFIIFLYVQLYVVKVAGVCWNQTFEICNTLVHWKIRF